MLRNVNTAFFFPFFFASAQTPPAAPTPAPAVRAARPPAPVRDPLTPGYVAAKELRDGEIPSPKADGNFIIGATHAPAPEMAVREGVPHGDIYNFTMESADSKFYPGIARETPAPGETPRVAGAPRVIAIHPAPYTRTVSVYV